MILKKILAISAFSALIITTQLSAKINLNPVEISICEDKITLNEDLNTTWFQKSNNVYSKMSANHNCLIKTNIYRKKEIIIQASQTTKSEGKINIPRSSALDIPFHMARLTYFTPSGDIYTKFYKDHKNLKKKLKLKLKHLKSLNVVYKNENQFLSIKTICKFDGGSSCYESLTLGNIDLKKKKAIAKKNKKLRKNKR